MKHLINLIITLALALSIGMVSCSDMDDYLKYTDGGSKQYTGIVDSAQFLSGDNRVIFSGMVSSDPKITKVRVFWNMRKDSLTLDIDKSSGHNEIYHPIILSEGKYSFEVISYDNKGVPSIVVHKQGVSYGDLYRSGLYNRAIKSFEKVDDEAIIEWYNADENSPFVEVLYESNDGNKKTIRVPQKEERTVLSDYKSASSVQFQSYYLPNATAVDTFKSVVESSIAVQRLSNAGNPFKRGDQGTGKWGLLADWSYTNNILNQEGNTLGGWSHDSGGVIHLESQDWGGPGFDNGKIYQNIVLPKGKYALEYYSDGMGGNAKSMFAVALGGALPDIEDANNTLACEISENGNATGNHTINFTLDEPSSITVGWVITISSPNTWYHINWIKLTIAD